jgi:hypothetical protein
VEDAARPGGLAEGPELVREAIRTPRAAGLAGIVFAVITSVSLALIDTPLTQPAGSMGPWLAEAGHRRTISVVLALIPIAGIAFLWFIGVVRGHLGDSEDRFFSTVFLGSGLLFIAMLLAAAAVMAGVAAAAGSTAEASSSAGTWAAGALVGRELVETAARLSAVFTLAATTTVLRGRRAPRWLGAIGYVVGLALLLLASVSPLIFYLFPAWVLMVSVYILIVGMRSPATSR